MSHKLYDITLYYNDGHSPKEKIFTQLQNVVSQLFVYYLYNYKPKGTTRVSVNLNEGESKRCSYFGSILCINYTFDKELFWVSNLQVQKKMILDALLDVSLFCSEKYGWDRLIFEQAYQKVINTNYENVISYQRKLCRDKKKYGEVIVKTVIDKAIVSVRITDLNGMIIKESQLFTSPQHEMFYGFITKNSKWISTEEYGCSNDIFDWIVDLKSDSISLTVKQNDKDIIKAGFAYNALNNLEFENKQNIISKLTSKIENN